MANGNQQSEGLDYSETFSPVIKQPTIRVVLTLAVHHHWKLRQLDVSNAFLHGIIEEEVFMRQPQGYRDNTHPHFVCKLHKALYGLKQTPRAWFAMFSGCLLHLGFSTSSADPALFILKNEKDITLVLVYVDDIVITGSNDTYISELISLLSTKFVLKDLGILHYFLGLEVHYHGDEVFLSQTKYATDLLNKAGMLDCKAGTSPSLIF